MLLGVMMSSPMKPSLLRIAATATAAAALLLDRGICAVVGSGGAGNVARQTSTIDRSTLNGKLFVGYQGWFRKPNTDDGNSHWTTDTPEPQVGHVGVDLIPDVTGYPEDCLFDTVFTLPDGSPAQFYSNDCDGVVDLHFSMMADHGIDGAFVQRFYFYPSEEPNGGWNRVLENAKDAAFKYGRGLVIEYDLNGASSAPGSSNVAETILADLASLSDVLGSPVYMHQGGKPVVEVWGVGIVTAVSVDDSAALVAALQGAGYYVILGVQQAWHAELVEDQPGGYGSVYALADMLQPWTVGAYDRDGYPGFRDGRQATEDKAALAALGIESSVVVWPGGSNSNADPGDPAAFDRFPRWNGTFYQAQLDGAVDVVGPNFIFGAMFDEVNEGTAIYPVLKRSQLPTNQRFLGVDDDLAPDAYLTMAGDAAARLAQVWASM